MTSVRIIGLEVRQQLRKRGFETLARCAVVHLVCVKVPKLGTPLSDLLDAVLKIGAAPQQLSSADRRRLAAELAQRHEALEAMPYAPSAESIAAYNKRTRATKWNSFQSRNAGKGFTMEELRRRYNLIEAAAARQ
jgi:hypothetical protein